MGASTKKRQTVKIGVFIISIFVICFSVSYAFLNQTFRGTKKQVITAGNLEIQLAENDAISLVGALPSYDEVGMIGQPFTFILQNKSEESANYVLRLEDVTKTDIPKLDTSLIRYGLTKDGKAKQDSLANLENSILDSGVLDGNQIISYELRLWIDFNVTDESLINGKSLSYKINAEIRQATTYTDAILNGCDPVLGKNLVPVTIANDGVVTKANIKKAWYNYANKEWANAVVLEDSAKAYKTGDVIDPADIESYFVWIPRYRYKIFNDGNYTGDSSLNENAPQPIEIEFESKNTSPTNGAAKDEWLSHPAFQAFDTNGFWVGKFESGYRGATSTSSAEVGTADSTKLIIKPNSYSWRSITVGNMFKTSYEYLRDNESHMMKNTEWGAVAYLSHSQYGVNTEVYINNNSSYLTGCGGDTASASYNSTCFNAYGSKADGVYNQSTTGNISGIFDMSGGAWEYVMGYNTNASSIGGSSGITGLYSDFFTNSEWEKYYDKYVNASTSYTTYNQRILGDATGEMGPFKTYQSSWYSDHAYFAHSSLPWFIRGGLCLLTSATGIFYFNSGPGDGAMSNSFRVVLSVTG